MTGIPSWAVRGAKVVCIATAEQVARGRARNPWGNYPDAGGVYTIRGSVTRSDGVENLLLEEVVNPPMACVVGVVEWGFEAKYFRPVKSLDQDIAEHFSHHLRTDQRVPEKA